MKEKPTQLGVDRIIARMSDLKARLDKVVKIGLLKNLDGWAAYSGVLEEQAVMMDRTIKSLVEDGDHLDDSDMRKKLSIAKATRDAFRWAIKIGEAPDTEAQKLKEAISELEQNLAEKRQEIEAYS